MTMPRPLPLLRALRPSQWIKNSIVPVAYFFARWDPSQQSHLDAWALPRVLLAAVIFCAVSSGVYLLNDLHDVAADRTHPTKRLRPIAAGQVSAAAAWTMAVALAAAGLVCGWRLAASFGWLLAGYLLLQVAYTCALKRVALLDVFIIAIGFVLRAIGGALVIDVRISPWLLLCAFLLALFLGLCKRRHEKRLLDVADAQQHREALAAYDARLLDMLISIAASATVVAYALYTLSSETVARFGTARLGLTIPFVLFGIFRYLDLVYRHEQGGRPEKVLLNDRVMIATVLLY
jgi:4-hydroxybenzoate polyprenyltransferase